MATQNEILNEQLMKDLRDNLNSDFESILGFKPNIAYSEHSDFDGYSFCCETFNKEEDRKVELKFSVNYATRIPNEYRAIEVEERDIVSIKINWFEVEPRRNGNGSRCMIAFFDRLREQGKIARIYLTPDANNKECEKFWSYLEFVDRKAISEPIYNTPDGIWVKIILNNWKSLFYRISYCFIEPL